MNQSTSTLIEKIQNPILHSFNPSSLSDPTPFGYSHIVEVQNHSRTIHLAGQGGENTKGDLGDSFELQLIQTFANIEAALQYKSATFFDIAILRILVVAHDSKKHQLLIREMNRIWPDQNFPACTLIPVPCLAIEKMLIEIEATAYCY